ncbi:MAG: hypothetical protein KatS3mg129_1679 [Leptospiraceae bacterium]|nr:MAG: hypothetical protein KatS3mg129_1679 [Leptospiraceae bacterium]
MKVFKIFLLFLTGLYFILVLLTFLPYYKYDFLTFSDIRQDDIVLHIRYIADDSKEGRYPGSNGSKKVQEWIINFYKKWHLFPLFNGSYLQSFTFKGRFKKYNNNYITILDCSNCNIPIEPMPLGISGTFRGKLIYGDYCIEEKKEISKVIIKYKIKNPSEYIIICKRYGAPEYEREYPKEFHKWITFQNKYKNIDKLGFMGVIFLRDDGDVIKTEYLSFYTKGKAFSVFLDNQIYKKRYQELIKTIDKQKEVLIEIHYNQEELEGKNIGASLKEFKENQKIIYIGAHYDHLGYGIPQYSLGSMGEIYNGADDNASGTVAVLELAEYLSNEYLQKNLKLPEEWNIIFLHFDAEEWGLLGSNHFVESEFFSKQNIAMFNFDMIGRYRQNLQIQGLQTGDIVWQNSIKTQTNFFNNKHLLNVNFIEGARGPSDHTSFYRKKMPVLFFFTGTHEDYHKPTDDFDKINYKEMTKIIELAKNIILDIIHKNHIPEYQYIKENRKQTYRFKLRLGIIPGNYFSNEGIQVAGFVENAPIKKSGIKEGDIIIQIEQYKIQTIYDLMEFLSKAKLGLKYKIIYKRNDKIYETYTELMGE